MVPGEEVLPGLLQRRLISKIKQYDVIDKIYVRGKGRFSQKITLGHRFGLRRKKSQKRDANDDKRSTLYNILVERASEKFACTAYELLFGISQISPIIEKVPGGGCLLKKNIV